MPPPVPATALPFSAPDASPSSQVFLEHEGYAVADAQDGNAGTIGHHVEERLHLLAIPLTLVDDLLQPWFPDVGGGR